MGAGRGRTSGAGGGRGGGGGGGGGVAPPPTTNPITANINESDVSSQVVTTPPNNNANAGNRSTGVDLTRMSDAQLATFTQNAMRANMPSKLNSNDPTQRLIYAAKWNDKPEVLSAARVEAMAQKRGAVVIYRTVDGAGGMSSKQVADDFRNGGVFKTAGNGARAYGGGAYFTDDLGGSQRYGRGSNPQTIMGVLNKNAKVVDMYDLQGAKGVAWIRSHPKAAKELGLSVNSFGSISARTSSVRNIGEGDRFTSLAVAMGYNVVKTDMGRGESYYTILNRKAVTTSSKNYYNS